MNCVIRVACIQNNASSSVENNIQKCTTLVRAAAAEGAQLITTPEYFSGLKFDQGKPLPAAFKQKNHPVIDVFIQLAQELNVSLLLGSVGVVSDRNKIYNRSILINNKGRIIKHYDKIHMFDVNLGDGELIQESATIEAGNSATLAHLHDLTIGMSICYDLRFPHLYRQLAQSGANVLAVPAAFTKKTGQAHWHILNRARAIENACFVIAPCQYGRVEGGGYNYGHSLIVNPWGEILADAGDAESYIVADIDPDLAAQCRRRIPSLQNECAFSAPE